MKKTILTLIFTLMFTGCTLDWHVDEYCGPGTNRTCGPVTYTEPGTSYIEVVFYSEPDLCFEDPYWHTEEWCDYYDDGAMCCVWYIDGWFEEWCQWGYDYCWEYEGSF